MNGTGRLPDLDAHAKALDRAAASSERLSVSIDQAPGRAVQAADHIGWTVSFVMLLWFALKIADRFIARHMSR